MTTDTPAGAPSQNVTPTTTVHGYPVQSDEYSAIVGKTGPIVLHDSYLLEKHAHFNRERVPERVVHAKGGGAFGTFTVTGDVSSYTCAKVFAPGSQVRVLARFSTVAGEQGSPDTWRDPRGFSIKFYGPDGNYDLVGNNTPIFFVRDGMKFPDFIRSQKRHPATGLRDHNMQWDFWTLSPESAHQVTYLMGDRGIPKTWRHMNGYGSHTFQWINADGERCWVKYHFISNQGVEGFTQQDADKMAGQESDYHRKDLFEAIERGDNPSWTLKVQIMPHADAENYRFNPFDVTKVWPHSDYPLIEVGTLELNENPENFHAQIEQAAFEPNNMPAGIAASPDKMLLARLVTYADAHRYRIGINYHQLPVNKPECPVHTYAKDGQMQTEVRPADMPVYAPNSYGGPAANPELTTEPESGWSGFTPEIMRTAYLAHEQDDDFGQAGTLVREVMDDAQRERLVSNIAGHVADGVKEPVLSRVFEYWRHVDADLGARVEKAVRDMM